MDMSTAASIFRALGSEKSLALFRRLAEAAPGLPLPSIEARAEGNALAELEAVGLVRRNEGVGAPWYEANPALLLRALSHAVT